MSQNPIQNKHWIPLSSPSRTDEPKAMRGLDPTLTSMCRRLVDMVREKGEVIVHTAFETSPSTASRGEARIAGKEEEKTVTSFNPSAYPLLKQSSWKVPETSKAATGEKISPVSHAEGLATQQLAPLKPPNGMLMKSQVSHKKMKRNAQKIGVRANTKKYVSPGVCLNQLTSTAIRPFIALSRSEQRQRLLSLQRPKTARELRRENGEKAIDFLRNYARRLKIIPENPLPAKHTPKKVPSSMLETLPKNGHLLPDKSRNLAIKTGRLNCKSNKGSYEDANTNETSNCSPGLPAEVKKPKPQGKNEEENKTAPELWSANIQAPAQAPAQAPTEAPVQAPKKREKKRRYTTPEDDTSKYQASTFAINMENLAYGKMV